MSDFKIFAAPLQGYTDAPWRSSHAHLFGGIDEYFTPFLRVEKGEIRRRDLRDVLLPLNEGINTTPQIIIGTTDEFRLLADTLAEKGFDRIDINMGCPFPPQVHHGRGAGMIARTEMLEALAEEMTRRPHITFSVKMRLGAASPDEWRVAMPVINRMPLRYVTLHPRIATQQYRGELNYREAASFIAECVHPVIFNGELHSLSEIPALRERFPSIAGVMLGRGLLARPSLGAEYHAGCELSINELTRGILSLHESVYMATAPSLCGDAQILAKMKPFWDYAGANMNRKAVKAIIKARTAPAYLEAVHRLTDTE